MLLLQHFKKIRQSVWFINSSFFYANTQDSIALDVNTKDIDKVLEDKISKGKDMELDKALKQALSTL